jgi:hypothetical protein
MESDIIHMLFLAEGTLSGCWGLTFHRIISAVGQRHSRSTVVVQAVLDSSWASQEQGQRTRPAKHKATWGSTCMCDLVEELTVAHLHLHLQKVDRPHPHCKPAYSSFPSLLSEIGILRQMAPVTKERAQSTWPRKAQGTLGWTCSPASPRDLWCQATPLHSTWLPHCLFSPLSHNQWEIQWEVRKS